MRVYVPVGRLQLEVLRGGRGLDGPLTGWAVDPGWRTGSPEVDEEQWEHEAQTEAAATLTELARGLVLAVDVPDEAVSDPDDGRVIIPGGVRWSQVGALLDRDLAWFGLQELDILLSDRRTD